MGVIRLLLAISVVIAHAGPVLGLSVVGGQVAVEAFFIISGFYMSLILNEKYIGQNDSFKLFLSNRLLRLFPLYWTVLLLVIGSSLFMGIYTQAKYWGGLDVFVKYSNEMGVGSFLYLFLVNLGIIGQDLALFMGLDTSTGNLFLTSNFWLTDPPLYKFLLIPQAWSVSIELMFYLMAPFIVRRSVGIVLLFIGLSAGIRLLLLNFNLENDPWNYRFFPNELIFFLLGTLSYRLYKRMEHRRIRPGYLAAIWVGLLLFTIFYGHLNFPFKMQLYFGAFFLSLPFIFTWSKHSKVDMKIGDLSYPVYLVHVFLIPFVVKIPLITKLAGTGGAVVMISICISYLLNKLISEPVERIRQRRLATANTF